MPDQTTIRTTIREGVLTRLGVLAAGASPSPADTTLVDAALSRLIDDLAADGTVRFSALAIPSDAIHGLIGLLADALSVEYGLANGPMARLAAQANAARRAFRARRDGGAGTHPVRFRNF